MTCLNGQMRECYNGTISVSFLLRPPKNEDTTIVGEWTLSNLKVRFQDIGKNVCYTH